MSHKPKLMPQEVHALKRIVPEYGAGPKRRTVAFMDALLARAGVAVEAGACDGAA